MNRRIFLSHLAALGLAGSAPLAASSQSATTRRPTPFRPTRFSVEVRGHGPDVILIPGLSSSRAVWNDAVAAVPGYRYHLLQVAGFAGEPARGNADGAVVRPLADELARYIASRGLRRPALIGHSMGGTVATLVATRRPELVGRLMVVDILPQPRGLFGGESLGRMAEGLNDLIADPAGRRLLGSIVSAFSPPDAPGNRSDPDVVARTMHELGPMDLTADLPRIQAPTTIVYGVRDAALREAAARQFAHGYRGLRSVRLVRIDGSGHLVMIDQPQRFATAMRSFLQAR